MLDDSDPLDVLMRWCSALPEVVFRFVEMIVVATAVDVGFRHLRSPALVQVLVHWTFVMLIGLWLAGKFLAILPYGWSIRGKGWLAFLPAGVCAWSAGAAIKILSVALTVTVGG